MNIGVCLRRSAAFGLIAQGAHTALVPSPALKARAEDELDGCADDTEAGSGSKPPRPGTIDLRELLPRDGRFLTAPEDTLLVSAELERDTRRLLLDFYRAHTGLSPATPRRHPALTTLKRVVTGLLDKHRIAYTGMLRQLHFSGGRDELSIISSVAHQLFSDGVTNWGRVCSLVAFGAVVCVHLQELRGESCAEHVGDQISSYLISEQHDWLLNNKGWQGLVEFFGVEDVECVVRNTLMAVAGVAGIGAGLALLIR